MSPTHAAVVVVGSTAGTHGDPASRSLLATSVSVLQMIRFVAYARARRTRSWPEGTVNGVYSLGQDGFLDEDLNGEHHFLSLKVSL